MDRTLRLAERSGDPVTLLRERLRAGTLTRDKVRLAAYLGDEAAFMTADDPGNCRCYDIPFVAPGFAHQPFCEDGGSFYSTNFSAWTTGLLPLMKTLGKRESVGACPGCKGTGHSCQGTLKVTLSTPWAQWLSVVGALAVGRACIQECQTCGEECGCDGTEWDHTRFDHGTCASCVAAEAAMDAAQAWVDEPSEVNYLAWEESSVRGLTTRTTPNWVPIPWRNPDRWGLELAHNLRHASPLLNEADVRAICRDAVVPLVLA